MTGVGDDERAVSEASGAAILVVMTVLVTASVGLNVLILSEQDDTAGPNAEFTFEYFGDASALLVTHNQGDSFEAGNLLLESSRSQATWAAVAGMNDTQQVEPGATVQLSAGGEFGSRVAPEDTVTVYYVAANATKIRLDSWNGTSN